MRIYNTLTRSTEDIQPLNHPTVTVYTCGPTVYDYPHIGNWFTYIREDILIRTLQGSGLQPKWVMNITDVGHLVSDADDGEDKLEKGAKREGKTAWDIAAHYTAYFIEGMKRLGMLVPEELPKATDHIPEQIALIKTLEAKGYTYVISDGVYFDTAKFPRYAEFARLDIDEQQAGARVEYNREKRNPTDFALWKFSPVDHQRDMEWPSEWGKGFPGWHIECSAMSMKYLGETIDIHAGGIDHVPVHHTNEIAQSEAATGKQFARYWMHSNHITINDEKISKSLGNGITLEDIEAKGYELDVLRLHVLESHYRSQSKFSWDSLEAAKNRLDGWRQVADLRWQLSADDESDPAANSGILAALQNDLDTPAAMALINRQFDLIESNSTENPYGTLLQLMDEIKTLIGIDTARDNISFTQARLIAEREAARAAQDWSQSDTIRDQLLAEGIGLRDTPAGVRWYRI